MPQPDIYIDPNRPRPHRKPLKAWRHMQKLLADKEDTEQVFYIIQALNGDSLRRDLNRFATTENGNKLLKERSFLPDMLDDHGPLEQLPDGSVGRAYVDFMRREGLSAHGLVEESLKQRRAHDQFDDDLSWYADRSRDTHDLYHVLTGYGRDSLGEAALLAYTHQQHGGFGIQFIAYMGQRQITKFAPKSARIAEVMKEARAHGKAATPVIDQDIPALLAENLEEARARLNIAPPSKYREALHIIEAAIAEMDSSEAFAA
ncbi:MAG: Coq4 family protein [Henriciella sp.]|nr:Coq4 family protein [Henriciella sp.]